MSRKEEILKAKFANYTFQNLTAKEEEMILEAMSEYAKEAFEASKKGGIERVPVVIDQYGSVNIEEHFVANLYPTFEDYEKKHCHIRRGSKSNNYSGCA